MVTTGARGSDGPVAGAAMRLGGDHWMRAAWPAACTLLLAGCQQKMADQPSLKPLVPSDFFHDGRSERPLVPGTVARGHLRTDAALFTGRPPGPAGGTAGAAAAVTGAALGGLPAALALASGESNFVDAFPFPLTEAVVEHGRNRYMIYCVVCHDPLGTGRGKIVERGYTPPPSYHIERLRKAPIGRFFAVMTEGYGSMPSYAAQIPVHDRWSIASYVRALQLSQNFPVADLPAEVRAKIGRGPGAPKGDGR